MGQYTTDYLRFPTLCDEYWTIYFLNQTGRRHLELKKKSTLLAEPFFRLLDFGQLLFSSSVKKKTKRGSAPRLKKILLNGKIFFKVAIKN